MVSDWREVLLGDVAADVTVGYVGPMASEYIDAGVPFLRSLNVQEHHIDLADLRYISAEFNAKLQKSCLRPGDVVTVRTGKPGSTAVIPRDLPVANCSDLVIIRPGKSLNARWLSYYINCAAKGFIASRLVGAVQQHFNVGAAKEMTLLLPPLGGQEAIAEVLGAIDDKIVANSRAQGAARSLAVTAVGKYVARCVVGDIASLRRGTVPPNLMAVEGVTHFSLPAFDRGFATVEAPTDIKSSKYALDGPVVLVSKLNPRIPRIWPLDILPAGQSVASTEFVPLTPREGIEVGELWAALAASAFSATLLAHVAGTTGSHQRVRPTDVLAVPITDVRAIPDRVRDAVRRLCRLVNNRTQESLRLAATRDELLPLLMNGRITVKDAERRVEEEV